MNDRLDFRRSLGFGLCSSLERAAGNRVHTKQENEHNECHHSTKLCEEIGSSRNSPTNPLIEQHKVLSIKSNSPVALSPCLTRLF